MATSAVKMTHGFSDPLSKPVMESNNPDFFSTDMPRMYPIHRHINIYSVARRTFKRQHPYFKGELKACVKDAEGKIPRYVLCYKVPDPPQQISIDAERGGKRVDVEPRDEAGWRVAIDILNPNNPSTDPYWKMSAKQAAVFSLGEGQDVIRYGVFPSLNDPPTEEELLKAEAVRDESYQLLVDEAFAERESNPQGFRRWLRQHPWISEAMEALGIEADWHKPAEIKMKCPNCGDSVKQGIAFHKSSAGVLCIIDAERAAKAGVEVKRGPGRPPKED